jgi:hypothetical protein
MRSLLIVPLLSLATPALAQAYPMPAPTPLPPRMMDPALPGQLGRMAGALTHAIMNLPVGELEAAIEGRPAFPADRRKTVGSEVGRDNPYVEQDIQRDVTSTTSAVQSSARAIQRAMPAIQQAVGEAAATIERETANLPSPYYPRR